MYRIIIGTLLPIILMSFYSVYLTVTFSHNPPWSLTYPTIWDYIFYLVKSFFVALALIAGLAGIPSLLSSILMEKIINPAFHNHFIVIVISTLLGFISGILISLIIRGIDSMPLNGAIVGALTGLVLRYLYIKAQ